MTCAPDRRACAAPERPAPPAAAVTPRFGGGGLGEMAEPSRRHPVALAMLHGMQQEQRDAIQSTLTATDAAVRHALDAGQRLMAARDPVEAMVAQTGLAIAFGEFAGAPLRAWLDALPKLHDCCMEAARETQNADQVPTLGAAAKSTAPDPGPRQADRADRSSRISDPAPRPS